jgi:hypothetical protein
MPKYFKAATNIVGVPQKMVFVDKQGEPHLLPSLTPKKHIASNYGQSAILTDYNTKPGNLIKVSKGEYTNYNEKIKNLKKEKLIKDEKKAAAKLAEKAKINITDGTINKLGKALKKHNFIRLKKNGIAVYALIENTWEDVDNRNKVVEE